MIIENGKTFHLVGKNISYILYINKNDEAKHYYYGKKLPDRDYGAVAIENSSFFHEYPDFGRNDLRTPAYSVINDKGNAVSSLKYKSHKIYKGKYSLEGMPSLYEGDCHAETLELTLYDSIAGFEAILYYSVFDEYDIVTRCVKIVNTSENDITVTKAMSTNLELPIGQYETVHFAGAWGRERYIKRMNIEASALIELSNTEGTGAPRLNPFIMVCEKGSGENHGSVYGFSLIYSTDFAAHIFMDEESRVRVNMGVNPQTFSEKLSANEAFLTPECVMCYSPEGFEALSQTYHEVYNNNLSLSKWAKKDRPVLFNSWEGTYGKFDEELLLNQAKKAASLGMELFVLDDGWFGNPKGDATGVLGDWHITNYKKLPSGLDGLAKKINDMGMEFGLWFEPESFYMNSEVYKAHPDWVIHVPEREPTLWFHRYLWDLSREDVQNYLIDTISNVLNSANISYVKWDMNRSMTDRCYMGYPHKYVLGLYRIMDELVKRFPDVLFEGCSAGGGRFDAGILAYMPQYWTSDDTDPIERLKIQYGTSFVYPQSAMSAHISASPNHQTKRVVPMGLRTAIAQTGSFGYELDLNLVTDEECEEIKKNIIEYKKNRNLLRCGKFYRLENPFEGDRGAWMTVGEGRKEAIVTVCNLLRVVNTAAKPLKLRGLNENSMYEDVETGKRYYGSELMNRGIELDIVRDFAYRSIKLKEV